MYTIITWTGRYGKKYKKYNPQKATFSVVSNMDLLTKSVGLHHIAERIFANLDHENLLMCQEVNGFWRNVLDNPKFWIKKCKEVSHSHLPLNSFGMCGCHLFDILENSKKFFE